MFFFNVLTCLWIFYLFRIPSLSDAFSSVSVLGYSMATPSKAQSTQPYCVSFLVLGGGGILSLTPFMPVWHVFLSSFCFLLFSPLPPPSQDQANRATNSLLLTFLFLSLSIYIHIIYTMHASTHHLRNQTVLAGGRAEAPSPLVSQCLWLCKQNRN